LTKTADFFMMMKKHGGHMDTKGKQLLSELEEIVLLALIKLGPESYGVPIHETVEEATERFISIGAIYAALDRMERSGYVSSRVGEATAERGGRAKKYFKIEGAGILALKEAERIRRTILPKLNWQPAGRRP
jgi:PadR family transcriptional regulator